MEIHEGTSTVKEAKLYLFKENFSEFTMKKDESIAEMFNRLNDIVNDLKGLGFEVPDGDFNHKFLRCLPERYDTIVTLLVRSNVKTATPTQILGEILTHDMFKKSQDEAHGGEIDVKKKSVAFKAQDSKNEEESGCQEEESDEEMALFVKRFNRMMSKKNFGKRGQSSRKNPFVDKTCFNCGEVGHIIVNCPNKKKDKKNDEKKKKKFIKKKKNGQAYFVEWDSDASSDDDDDDDKPSKGVAGIAIKEAPSLFSTPHCLMAKGGAKVNYKSGGRHWVLDSGCTQYMTGDPMMFSSLDENVGGYSDIIFGDNSRGKVKGIGTIPISSDHSLSKVLLVDSLKFNLLAVTQLCDFGYKCSFTKDDVVVTSLDGKDHIFTGFRHEDVYLVDFATKEANLSTCLFTQSSLGWLWHRRLGHVGMKQLNRLLKHDLVVGLKNVKFEKDKLCSACQAGK